MKQRFCFVHSMVKDIGPLLVLMQPVSEGDKVAVHYFDSMASDTRKSTDQCF